MRFLIVILFSLSFSISSTQCLAQAEDIGQIPSGTGETDPAVEQGDSAIENEAMREQYHDAFGKDDAEPGELPPYEPVNSRDARELSTIGIFYTYTPYAILVSGRHGFELDWLINEDWSLTGEYGKASYSASRYSIDLASFSETVYGLHARYYPGNSFNLQFGVGRRKHELKLGNDLLASGSRKISVETSVLHFAFGNRWQWANGISLGADWLIFDIPVGPAKTDDKDLTKEVRDDDDRDTVKDIVSAMRYFPTVGVVRVGLGYVF